MCVAHKAIPDKDNHPIFLHVQLIHRICGTCELTPDMLQDTGKAANMWPKEPENVEHTYDQREEEWRKING